ncbi:MAG: hypothetical protein ACREP2_07970 [Rhodanobacteraceae bacterium]
MYKQISLILIFVGLVIIVYAVTAAQSFTEDLQQLCGQIVADRSVPIALAGLIISAIGIRGLLTDRSTKRKETSEN